MKVILLERVENLGQMGDTVNVKPGYARNYLLPQGKAMRATEENQKLFEQRRAELEARNIERRREAAELAEKIKGRSLIVIRQAGRNGNLYGSVSAKDIQQLLGEDGLKLERRQIVLERPIKELGLYDVRVYLHPEVAETITVNVAQSEEEARRQARGESVREEDEEILPNPEDLIDEEEEEDEEDREAASAS